MTSMILLGLSLRPMLRMSGPPRHVACPAGRVICLLCPAFLGKGSLVPEAWETLFETSFADPEVGQASVQLR